MAGAFRFPVSPDTMYNVLVDLCRQDVSKRYREFRLTDSFAEHLRDIAGWLTGDSPQFGLFLCGGVGNGKSTVLRALGELAVQWTNSWGGWALVSAKDVVRFGKAYASPNDMNFLDADRFRQAKTIKVLGIDDMGEEPQSVLSYGDTITPMSDLISERYNHMLTTLVSSNMAAKEVGNYYGERIHDRMKEMMKVIEFRNEPSFRTMKTI